MQDPNRVPRLNEPSLSSQVARAALHADQLIAEEIALTFRLYPGSENENAKGELIDAAIAQATFIRGRDGIRRDYAAAHPDVAKRFIDQTFADVRDGIFPPTWPKHVFRDYGSDVANLVVAAAYLRNEIKRRIFLGEDTHRTTKEPR